MIPSDIPIRNPYFILTVLFILIIVSYVMRKQDERIASMENKLAHSNRQLTRQLFQSQAAQEEAERVVSDRMYAVMRDQQRLVNPLLPPERSYPYLPMRPGLPVNIPTRGESSGFQQMGVLMEEGVDPSGNRERKLLPVYGEQTYPGSNQYRYYTNTDGFQSVKLPIQKGREDCMDERGCSEIYDGDSVSVGGYNRDYKVQLYKLDRPRYNPYII
jgi:hypothetical protein